MTVKRYPKQIVLKMSFPYLDLNCGPQLWNIISSVKAAESLAAFNKGINDIDDSLLPLMLVKVYSLFSPFYPSRL